MTRHILVLLSAAFLVGCESMPWMTGGDHSKHHMTYLPGDLKWEETKSLPPGAKIAMLEGALDKPGFFTARAMLPDGYKVPPHWHPGVERVTVLEGTFYLGEGEKWDESSAKALTAGTYSTMPAGMRHYGWAKGRTVLQISSIGPWGITYVNPADDPRKMGK
jgi:quercetin dioxygenase-like cupin family protein